jgi:hypothetical protein
MEVLEYVKQFAVLVKASDDAVRKLIARLEGLCARRNGHVFVELDPNYDYMKNEVNTARKLLSFKDTFAYKFPLTPDVYKAYLEFKYFTYLRKNGWQHRKAFREFERNMDRHVADQARKYPHASLRKAPEAPVAPVHGPLGRPAVRQSVLTDQGLPS